MSVKNEVLFMTLLAKRSIIKEDKSNIITLGAIAKEQKKADPSVVNATMVKMKSYLHINL